MKRFFKAIPTLDEFGVVFTEAGSFNVFVRDPATAMRVEGSIPGDRFDYLIANELSFAVNLFKIKGFFRDIYGGDVVKLRLEEDRGLLSLGSRHLERKLRCLYPNSIGLADISFPEGSGNAWPLDEREFKIMARGLSQVSSETNIALNEKEVRFSAKNETDEFTFTKELDRLDGVSRREFSVGTVTDQLLTVSDHVEHGNKITMTFSEGASIRIRNEIFPRCYVLYCLPVILLRDERTERR